MSFHSDTLIKLMLCISRYLSVTVKNCGCFSYSFMSVLGKCLILILCFQSNLNCAVLSEGFCDIQFWSYLYCTVARGSNNNFVSDLYCADYNFCNISIIFYFQPGLCTILSLISILQFCHSLEDSLILIWTVSYCFCFLLVISPRVQ